MYLLKKFSFFVFALVVSKMAFASMDIDSRMAEVEKKVNKLYIETPNNTAGANLAIARPEIDGDKNFYLTVNVLYWVPKAGGTDYAYTDDSPGASLPIKGRMKDMSFKWDWGLRVGVGYNFDHDGWDTQLQYTWFDSCGSSTTTAGLNSSIVPLRGLMRVPTTGTDFVYWDCDSAKSTYDFTIHNLNLELGKNYYVGNKTSFRPHVGFTGYYFKLKQITRYTGGDLGVNTIHSNEYCDVTGLGLRTGFDSKWYLGNGLSLVGNFAGAMAFGYFDVDIKGRYTANVNYNVKLKANKHAFTPSAQGLFGLCYDKYVYDNKQHVSIGLAFETMYWWRMNQMLNTDDVSSMQYTRTSEDVSMHGVTLNFKWDF